MHTVRLEQHGDILPADTQTPISLYLDLVGDKPGILLESAEVDGRLGRYSLIAWDFRMLLSCQQGALALDIFDSRLDPLQAWSGAPFLEGLRGVLQHLSLAAPQGMDDLPPITRSLIGYFGYGLSGLLEPKLSEVLPPEEAQCSLVLPGKQILFDHLHHRCLSFSLEKERDILQKDRAKEASGAPEIGALQTHPGKEDFCSSVEATRELINSGEAIQVVLSTRFEAPFRGDPFVLYRRLRQANPSPYMFYLDLPELNLIGSSPELLVRSTNGVLEERPIAGTRHRGASPKDDASLAQELLDDPKERAEHVMLVDLGRNDLGRIARPGSVEVERFMQVERFSHVMHLTSYLRAALEQDLDSIDILRAAFPAGTVSGAPKIRAMEIIAQMEPFPRGPYAGAVGWLGLDEGEVNLDTGITIRTLWIRNDRIAWQAGAGIVSDSVPDKEWQECQNKARILGHILSQNGGSDVFAHR
jgi:anthranilate synthase component 1